MKRKLLFLFLSFILFFAKVNANETDFVIDVDKINIDDKSNSLIQSLDKTYNIDTKDFKKEDLVNEKAKEYTKELIQLTLGEEDYKSRLKDILNQGYLSDDNGFHTLTASMTIQNFMEDIHNLNISYDYIKLIKTVDFEEGVITYVYIPDATVDDEKTDLILTYYLKEQGDKYRLFIPWYTTGNDLEDYFKKLAQEEDTGDNVGDSYKSISLSNKENNNINEENLKKFYANNSKSNVSITAMKDNAVSVYGSGFFIRKGVVVTTWSLFLKCLNTSDFIYINDESGSVQKIDGVIAADVNYDVVVLKLKEEIGEQVTFGDVNTLKVDDSVLTINSKNNNYFSVNYGSYVSQDKGRIKNMFALTSSDEGSALYNINGEVIGMNTSSMLNSDMSIANSTNYLNDLQKVLLNNNFNDIKSTSVSLFKEKYYFDYTEEQKSNSIDDKVWEKYKNIGDLEENIKLELIKASYKDNILSLRYKNIASKYINPMFLALSYEEALINEGFELIYDNSEKKIYINDKYKVIIKESLDYLIIIIVEN